MKSSLIERIETIQKLNDSTIQKPIDFFSQSRKAAKPQSVSQKRTAHSQNPIAKSQRSRGEKNLRVRMRLRLEAYKSQFIKKERRALCVLCDSAVNNCFHSNPRLIHYARCASSIDKSQ